ncbi:MAG: hypothetical protein AAFO03_18885 [Bacteroidota bacterium]
MSLRRYPGAKPFVRTQAPLFHGREADIAQLHRLVSLESLVVLYGKSGYGKSSLLNAGLVPKLEEDTNAQPLSLRFQAWTPAEEASPVEKVVDELQQLPQDRQLLDKLGAEDNSLWSYTKAWQLAQPDGRLVLIFDQFEELFSYPVEQINIFKTQLAELLRGQLPDRYEALLDAATDTPLSPAEESALDRPLDLRILFSIRSDRMHLLDQLSDYLPQVLKNNYELKALKESDARRALVEPAAMVGTGYATAPFTYSGTAQEKILRFLRDEEHGRVEAIQLQILCTTFENRAIAEGLTDFDVAEIGDLQGVIDNYYRTQLDQISNEVHRQAAARLLEEGLVDKSQEQRLTLHESQIASIYGVGSVLLDQLVDSNLLRREPDRRQGYTYELSHDTLIKPAIVAREHREEQERVTKLEIEAKRLREVEELRKEKKAKRRLLWLSFVMGIFALLSVAGGLLAYQQYQKAQIATAAAEKAAEKATAAAEKASLQEQIAIDARQQAEADRDRASIAEAAALLAQDQAEAQRQLAEAEAAKGHLLEETLASENAFEYLLAEGHRFFGKGDFRNALTYWANTRFVNPDDSALDQLIEVAILGQQAQADFLYGRLERAKNTFKEILDWQVPIDLTHAQQRLNQIEQSQRAWSKLIGDRNLADIDTLIIEFTSIFVLPVGINACSQLRSLYIYDNDVLIHLPESLGQLPKLQSLYIYDNDALTYLPESLGQLPQLKTLDIRSNSNLTYLPERLGQLSKLQYLTVYDNEALGYLPELLGQLSELQVLEISANSNLGYLPESLGLLPQLRSLEVRSNSNLRYLPKSLGQLPQLRSLDIRSNNNLTYLPQSLGQLSQLQSLNIRSNGSLMHLPESLDQLHKLRSLYIYENNNLTHLPESVKQLRNVRQLTLSKISDLALVEELAPILLSIDTLVITNSNLTHLPESLGRLSQLKSLSIIANGNLNDLPESLDQMSQLQSLDIRSNPNLEQLSESLGQMSQLQSLDIRSNGSLINLPESIGQLTELRSVYIYDNDALTHLPVSIGQLAQLQSLNIISNSSLTYLPESLGQLSQLQALDISYNIGLMSLPIELGQLPLLQSLNISSNSSLTYLPESLGQLSKLQSLIIYGNSALTHLPESLNRLVNSLEVLDIRYGKFPKESVQYWKIALPNTEILSNYD